MKEKRDWKSSGRLLVVWLVLLGATRPDASLSSAEKGFISKIQSTVTADRHGRLRFGRQNLICIHIEADPSVIDRARKVGESFDSSMLGALESEANSVLAYAAMRHGFILKPTRSSWPNRINTLGHPAIEQECNRWDDTIHVKFAIAPNANSDGYQVQVRARQGASTYVATIDRAEMIHIPPQPRDSIDLSSFVTNEGQPYWDVQHDTYKLMFALRQEIFGRNIR